MPLFFVAVDSLLAKAGLLGPISFIYDLSLAIHAKQFLLARAPVHLSG